jgi:hypothetical protein
MSLPSSFPTSSAFLSSPHYVPISALHHSQWRAAFFFSFLFAFVFRPRVSLRCGLARYFPEQNIRKRAEIGKESGRENTRTVDKRDLRTVAVKERSPAESQAATIHVAKRNALDHRLSPTPRASASCSLSAPAHTQVVFPFFSSCECSPSPTQTNLPNLQSHLSSLYLPLLIKQ